MLNIDHLKKQAKLYVRWHRIRYFPVAAVIRWFLPRFQTMSDRDVLKSSFKLADAQELVARKHGFTSWSALIEGIKTMPFPGTSSTRTSVILAAEPQLFVDDIEATCQFYVQKLGFQIAFVYGQPPFYAQVVRDGGRLNMRKVDGPVFDHGFRTREDDALSATLTADDVKPLFVEFEGAGVTFHQKLKTEPWGARTFIVKDPSGNLIAFSGNAN